MSDIAGVIPKIALIACLILIIGYISPLFAPELRVGGPTVVIYGFSILEEVINHGIVPAFQARWRERTGEAVRFFTSFAGSGTVMNQIRFGAPADVAIFSHTLDAYRLQEAGRIRTDWKQLPHQGILNRTPIILIVRKGNPKQIAGFQDLRKPGIGIVHPDPQTSGGALWSILAEYGAFALEEEGGGPMQAADAAGAYQGLYELWKNVIVLGASARASRTQFEMGFGDALITYEQEAMKDLSRGKFDHELIVPKKTIYAEHQVAVIDGNIVPEERAVVEAFLDFLWTDEAQQIFVAFGFRSMTGDADRRNIHLKEIPHPFTVEALGGWKAANAQIIEALWKKRILEERRG